MANSFEIIELERLVRANTLHEILHEIKDGKTIKEIEDYVKKELEKTKVKK